MAKNYRTIKVPASMHKKILLVKLQRGKKRGYEVLTIEENDS